MKNYKVQHIAGHWVLDDRLYKELAQVEKELTQTKIDKFMDIAIRYLYLKKYSGKSFKNEADITIALEILPLFKKAS